MRKLVLVGCIAVVMAGSAAAQAPMNGAWAQKLFPGPATKEFGTVARGMQLKHSFAITNIYAVPLTLNTRVSCGCVKATPSKNVLQPNESATLDITMDSTKANGFKSVNVFVDVGPQFISTATLVVTVTARMDVEFKAEGIDFGMVPRGKSIVQTIDVEYAVNSGWRLTEIVKNGNAPFELKVEELGQKLFVGRQQPGYRIYATLKADAPTGPFREEILLKTNDPTSPVMTFPITGNIQAPLTASHPTITFTNVAAGVMQEQTVVIRGSQPFQIARIDGMGQGISCTFDDRPKTVHVLTVRCEMAQPTEVHKVLTIHSNNNGETVQVTVEAK